MVYSTGRCTGEIYTREGYPRDIHQGGLLQGYTQEENNLGYTQEENNLGYTQGCYPEVLPRDVTQRCYPEVLTVPYPEVLTVPYPEVSSTRTQRCHRPVPRG